MVPIGTGADKERAIAGGMVLPRKAPHLVLDEEFGAVAGQVDRLMQQRPGRHARKQRFGIGHTDHGQHLGALGLGMGKVTHGLLPYFVSSA